MSSKKIFQETNELIVTKISPRKVTYYLVTEAEMSNIENQSYIQDFLLFISSIFGAGFLSLYFTKFSDLSKLTIDQLNILNTWKIIILIITIITISLSIIFFFIRKNNLNKLQKQSSIQEFK